MRKSHVIGIAIVSLLTAGPVAQAQTAAPVAPQARQQRSARLEKGRGRLLRGITLSDAEQARVKEIRGKYQTESKALRERERTEIRAALPAEQQSQFDANVKQLDERRAGRKQGKGHRPRRADRVGSSKS